ncbi:MAG: OsmC family protein [Armatimonadota bacterium]
MKITATHIKDQTYKINARGHELITAKPREGEDYPISPPELFISSLASCIGIYAVDFLARRGVKTEGLEVEADFEKITEDGKTRLDNIKIKLTLPEKLDEKYSNAFLKVIDACLVHETIRRNPEIKIEVK